MKVSIIFAVASGLLAASDAASLRVAGDRREDLDTAWIGNPAMRECNEAYNAGPADCPNAADMCKSKRHLRTSPCCASYPGNKFNAKYTECRTNIMTGTQDFLNQKGNEKGKEAYGQVMGQTSKKHLGLTNKENDMRVDPGANVDPTQVGKAALAAFESAVPNADKLQHCDVTGTDPSNEDVFKCCPQADVAALKKDAATKNACCYMGRWIPLVYSSTAPVWAPRGKAKFCYVKSATESSLSDQIGAGPLQKVADRLSSVLELVKSLANGVRSKEANSVDVNKKAQEKGAQLASSHIASGKEKGKELEYVIQQSFADAQSDLRKAIASSEFLRTNTVKWQDSWAKEWVGLAKELAASEKQVTDLDKEQIKIGKQIVKIREGLETAEPEVAKCKADTEAEQQAVSQAKSEIADAVAALKGAIARNDEAIQANKQLTSQMKAKKQELDAIQKEEAEAKKKADAVKAEQVRVKKSVDDLTKEIAQIKEKTKKIQAETNDLEFVEVASRGTYDACKKQVGALPGKEEVADTIRYCLCDPKPGSHKLRSAASCTTEVKGECMQHGTLGYCVPAGGKWWSSWDAGSALSSVSSAEAYVEQVKAVIGIAMEEAERSFQGMRNYVTDQGKLNMIAESQDLKNTASTEAAMAVAKKALEKEFAKLREDAKKVQDNADTYLKMVHDYEAFLVKVHGDAERKSDEFLGLIKSSKDKADASQAEVDAGYRSVTRLQGQLTVLQESLEECGPKLKKLLGEKGTIAREQYALQKLTEDEFERSQALDSQRSELSIGLDTLNTKNRNAQQQVNALTEQLVDIQTSLRGDLASEEDLTKLKARKEKIMRGAQQNLDDAKADLAKDSHAKSD